MRKEPTSPLPQSTQPAPAASNPTVGNPATSDPGASAPLPKGGVSLDLSQQYKESIRASQEVAVARLSNQEGAGVKEWQTYQTPVSPANTPNMQAAAQSQQAMERGYTLQSNGPTETPQWVAPTPGPAAQETQQAGQALYHAGVTSGNPPLSENARAQMQAALDNSAQSGQNVHGESRVQEAARQASLSAPSGDEKDKSIER